MHFAHFLLDPDLIFGFPCRHPLYHLLVFCQHEVQVPFFTVPLLQVLGVVLHGKSHKKVSELSDWLPFIFGRAPVTRSSLYI